MLRRRRTMAKSSSNLFPLLQLSFLLLFLPTPALTQVTIYLYDGPDGCTKESCSCYTEVSTLPAESDRPGEGEKENGGTITMSKLFCIGDNENAVLYSYYRRLMFSLRRLRENIANGIYAAGDKISSFYGYIKSKAQYAYEKSKEFLKGAFNYFKGLKDYMSSWVYEKQQDPKLETATPRQHVK